MSGSLGLSQSLNRLVNTKFQQAKELKHVIYSETQLAVVQSPGIVPFQLRYLPSLVNKPTNNPERSGYSPETVQNTSNKPKHKIDPFDNVSEKLLVAQIPADDPTHNLVLNKFPVIPNHFILATKENKPQVYPLEANDIFLTYQCVKDWESDRQRQPHVDTSDGSPGRLFAFFNSGAESGASQPHRHIQFLPVDDMRGDYSENWSILVDSMQDLYRPHLDLRHNPALPFVHYAVDLDGDMSARELHKKYIFLLRASVATTVNDVVPFSEQDIQKCPITWTADHSNNQPEGDIIALENETLKNEVRIDYNLCLTTNRMAIIPRLCGDVRVPGATPEDGLVSVNGTILAGTLMTKSETNYQKLRQHPELVHDLLLQIGYIKPQGALGEQQSPEIKL